jgi:hypothetical protein
VVRAPERIVETTSHDDAGVRYADVAVRYNDVVTRYNHMPLVSAKSSMTAKLTVRHSHVRPRSAAGMITRCAVTEVAGATLRCRGDGRRQGKYEHRRQNRLSDGGGLN